MAGKKKDATEAPAAEQFDPKWIKGLACCDTKKEEIEDGEELRHVPVKRALRPGDVLGWKVYGNEVVIVTADGRKHRVKM